MTKEELQVELNMSEDLRLTERRGYRFYNALMSLLVLSMALLLSTRQCPW